MASRGDLFPTHFTAKPVRERRRLIGGPHRLLHVYGGDRRATLAEQKFTRQL